VTIGFKPVTAASGMRPDGTPALSAQEVGLLSVGVLQTLNVPVSRQFSLIPAVSAVVTPQQLDALLANPAVDYVQPEVLYAPVGGASTARRAQDTPWGITRIDAPSAWFITRGAGARLGMIDSGIDEDHPDLNVVGGINLVTGGTNRGDWDDTSPSCTSHGTHVAGTAAALDNDDGVVGVAPEVELYALRVFDPENTGLSDCLALDGDIIAALDYAVANGFDVVSLSLGSPYPSLSMGDAVQAAHAGDVIVVASAGNYGPGVVGYPGAFPQAIAVSAIDEFDGFAGFSSAGPEIDLAAPGVGTLSTWNDGGTGVKQGTSMASPHVAGVAALVRSMHPGHSPDEVRQILRSTAEDLFGTGFDHEAGYGLVHASNALLAVTGGAIAAAVIPGDLSIVSAVDGPTIIRQVELRNVGDPGTIDWTAGWDQSWLEATPSGNADDVTPSTIDITVEPLDVPLGLHTGFVTFDSDAANSPTTVRVQLRVADAVVIDEATSLSGGIGPGERIFYLFTGAVGQEIDIAVLRDDASGNPLIDPVVRLYDADGTTLLAMNDDAPWSSGLGLQSLIMRYALPDDGDYLIEVGGWGDDLTGDFLLKARPTGPILGTDVGSFALMRTHEEGPPDQLTTTVSNLTGVGSLDFTVGVSESWLSADPGSGTAAPARLVAPRAIGQPKTTAGKVPPTAGVGRVVYDGMVPPASNRTGSILDVARSGPAAVIQGFDITVTADPGGLGLGTRSGAVSFYPSDGWLPPNTLMVDFHIHTPGMEVVAQDYADPWGLTTDALHAAVGTTEDAGGTLIPISSDGTVGDVLATGFTPYPAGIATGQDGNWYVGSRLVGDPRIKRVMPDGSFEDFADLPATAFWVAAGPAGEFYASTCNIDAIYRVSSDGGTIDAFGPGVNCPLGIAYSPDEDVLYVAQWDGAVRRLGLDGSDHGSVANNIGDPHGVAVGSSGKVYVNTFGGELWVYDPQSGDDNAGFLGLSPAPAAGGHVLTGITLVDGALLMAGYYAHEFYRFPVDDGPAGVFAGEITVAFVLDALDVAEGEVFTIPLNIDLSNFAGAAASYTLEVGWDPDKLSYANLTEGDFAGANGAFVANDDAGGSGIVGVAAAEPNGRSDGIFTLFTLEVSVNPGASPGESMGIIPELSNLEGPMGENLMPDLIVHHGWICIDQYAFGDLTGNGSVSGGDAVQVLRFMIDLELAAGVDIGRGDLDGDGSVGLGDAIEILRSLVALPIPDDSRLGQSRVQPC
jgi:subtilisin